MKHYGDITKINGADVEPVWIITGGSPCQDLSVAGKRAGLAGERSGLFMEQIRIIKEMREHDKSIGRSNELIRPRYMVWENVPGAFSSNGGEDFRAVLEETARVAERDAIIPGLEGKQKWTKSGCIMGDGWSIAWRVHDAQFWGVPQRRKRIALVADFGGQSAAEILFERKGVSGDFEESGKEGEGASGGAERCADPSSYTLKIRGKKDVDCHGKKAGKGPLVQTELSGTLGVSQDQTLITNVIGFNRERCGAVTMNDAMPTLQAAAGESGNNQPMVCLNGQGGQPIVYSVDQGAGKSSYQIDVEKAPTLATTHDGAPAVVYDKFGTQEAANDMYVVGMAMQAIGEYKQSDSASSLKMRDYKDATDLVVSYGLDRASFNQGMNALYDFAVDEEKIGTQVAKGPGAVASFYPQMKAESQCWREDDVSNTLVNGTNPGFQNGICTPVVRRLTPLECERLQGYPDHWTDIGEWVDSKDKTHKDADSPRYKALGNSIALPFWAWMAERMVKYLEPGCTMASLFDGIGGFPLVFKRCGCKPVWASEIEDFPIAVTKIRFPEYD